MLASDSESSSCSFLSPDEDEDYSMTNHSNGTDDEEDIHDDLVVDDTNEDDVIVVCKVSDIPLRPNHNPTSPLSSPKHHQQQKRRRRRPERRRTNPCCGFPRNPPCNLLSILRHRQQWQHLQLWRQLQVVQRLGGLIVIHDKSNKLHGNNSTNNRRSKNARCLFRPRIHWLASTIKIVVVGLFVPVVAVRMA